MKALLALMITLSLAALLLTGLRELPPSAARTIRPTMK